MNTAGTILRWLLIVVISMFVVLTIEYWSAHPFLLLAIGSSLYGIAAAGRKKEEGSQ